MSYVIKKHPMNEPAKLNMLAMNRLADISSIYDITKKPKVIKKSITTYARKVVVSNIYGNILCKLKFLTK